MRSNTNIWSNLGDEMFAAYNTALVATDHKITEQ